MPPRGATYRLMMVAAMVAASLLVWWLLHRSWFMSSDDYLAISRGGRYGGAFTLGDWWDAWWDDWNRRNGRTSDSVLRLVLRPGDWFYPLFAPFMLTAAGLAVSVFISGSRRDNLGLWAVGLLLIPTVLWTNPDMSGDAVFWTAGAMNYVLPFALLVPAMIGFVKLAEGDALGWKPTALLCALVVLAGSLHESAALALLGLALALVVLRWGDLTREVLVLAAVTLLAFVFHMMAPGLWNRAGDIASDIGFLTRTAHNVAMAGSHLWQRSFLVWVVLALVLVGVSLTRFGGAVAGWLRTAAGSCLALCVAASLYLNRVPVVGGKLHERADSLTPQAWLVVVCFALSLGLVATVLFLIRSELGAAPVMSWVAFAGSSGFMLVAGLWSRAHFMVVTMMVLSLVCIAVAVVRRAALNERAVWGTVSALMAVVSWMWCDQAHVQLGENQRYVRSEVLPALEAAADLTSGEAVIPDDLPFPDFRTRNAFNMKYMGGGFAVVFGVDPDVSLVNS